MLKITQHSILAASYMYKRTLLWVNHVLTDHDCSNRSRLKFNGGGNVLYSREGTNIKDYVTSVSCLTITKNINSLYLTKMHWLLGGKSQLSTTNYYAIKPYSNSSGPMVYNSGALLPPPTLKLWNDSNLRSSA
jgi:hypothetical protein